MTTEVSKLKTVFTSDSPFFSSEVDDEEPIAPKEASWLNICVRTGLCVLGGLSVASILGFITMPGRMGIFCKTVFKIIRLRDARRYVVLLGESPWDLTTKKVGMTFMGGFMLMFVLLVKEAIEKLVAQRALFQHMRKAPSVA